MTKRDTVDIGHAADKGPAVGRCKTSHRRIPQRGLGLAEGTGVGRMVRAALHCAIAVVAILAICRPAVSFPINGPRPADKDTLGWGPRPIPINISVSPVVFVPVCSPATGQERSAQLCGRV